MFPSGKCRTTVGRTTCLPSICADATCWRNNGKDAESGLRRGAPSQASLRRPVQRHAHEHVTLVPNEQCSVHVHSSYGDASIITVHAVCLADFGLPRRVLWRSSPSRSLNKGADSGSVSTLQRCICRPDRAAATLSWSSASSASDGLDNTTPDSVNESFNLSQRPSGNVSRPDRPVQSEGRAAETRVAVSPPVIVCIVESNYNRDSRPPLALEATARRATNLLAVAAPPVLAQQPAECM